MARYDPPDDSADYPLYDSDDPDADLVADGADEPDPPERWRRARWAVYGGAFALPLALLVAVGVWRSTTSQRAVARPRHAPRAR